MKKLVMKLSGMLMALAVVAAELNVNATCSHYINQEPIPEGVRKLSKVK